MKLKIKKLTSTAKLPERANLTDAGIDLFADTAVVAHNNTKTSLDEVLNLSIEVIPDFIEYGTGIAVEIPEGHVGLLVARSSVTTKDLVLKNSVGIIDAGYRGELKMRFQHTNMDFDRNIYQVGDKIGQLVIVPIPSYELEEVTELSDSQRGEKGFGSSGIK